jgi:hypothetical protein
MQHLLDRNESDVREGRETQNAPPETKLQMIVRTLAEYYLDPARSLPAVSNHHLKSVYSRRVWLPAPGRELEVERLSAQFLRGFSRES